jgi:hypothetical protein
LCLWLVALVELVEAAQVILPVAQLVVQVDLQGKVDIGFPTATLQMAVLL